MYKKCLRFSIYIFVLTQVLQSSEVLCGDFLDVMLKQGPVRGYKLDSSDVFSFYGIPYATAPKGKDRYKMALPPPSWTKLLNATDKTIVCPQNHTEFGKTTLDCLALNVFVPDTEETKLPVFVYIHGGANRFGSALQSIPTTGLVQHGVIGVSFNYRLGPHGFLCLNTEFAPGNAAMKDQVLALRWVKENIEKFRGDPENVAIIGSSAGAQDVELQIASPMSTGLFIKAIAEGATGLSPACMNYDPIEMAEDYANQLGVYTNKSIPDLENFFASLTEEQLSIEHKDRVGFEACVEIHTGIEVEKFLVYDPIDVFRDGKQNKVKYIAGFTPHEGVHFLSDYETRIEQMRSDFSSVLPFNINISSQEEKDEIAQRVQKFYFPTGEITMKGYLELPSDSVFSFGSYAVARFQALHNSAYIYLFTYNGTLNLPDFFTLQKQFNLPMFPGHVPYCLYLQHYYVQSIYDNLTLDDVIMMKKLQKLYYNFLKFGDPTPVADPLFNNAIWLPVTPEAVNYLSIDSTFRSILNEKPLKDRFDLWDDIYKFNYSRNYEYGYI